jgi:hypothetical protein
MPFRASHAVPWLLALLLIALGLLVLTVRPARGNWSRDSSAHAAVSGGTGPHAYHAAASDGDGGAFVGWTRGAGSENYLFLQRVLHDGQKAPGWPTDGVPVLVQTGVRNLEVVESDGAGGAYVVWSEWRDPSGYDLLAQHVLATGALDPVWPAGGAVVSSATGNQWQVRAAPDAAGGAYLVWEDERAGAAAADVYAHRLIASGADPAWPANGFGVCTAANAQRTPEVIADGTGGLLVTWYDGRGGVNDLYAQKLSPGGVPAWTANGVPVCTAAGHQFYPRPATDGAGGAFIVWQDWRNSGTTGYDIFAQHLRENGTLDPAWLATGAPVSTLAGDQQSPHVVGDAEGGALVAWISGVSGSADLFATRLGTTGAVDPAWSAAYPSGFPLCQAAGQQGGPTLQPDGSGGALATWADYRSGEYDLYARRIRASVPPSSGWPANGLAVCAMPGWQVSLTAVPTPAGDVIVVWDDQYSPPRVRAALVSSLFAVLGGSSAPRIAGVTDVSDDMGGHVRVLWNGCAGDAPGLHGVATYRAWRRITVGGALAWEFIAEVPARGFDGYALDVETARDSSYSGVPWNVFVIRAFGTDGVTEYVSAPDSGYSVDDLSPSAPQQFAGERSSGVTTLRWAANGESDVVAYRLYAGASPEFVPAPEHLVAEVHATRFADPVVAPRSYRLSAVDARGNEGPFARLDAAEVTGGPPAGPGADALRGVWPNPVHGACAIEVALARAGPAALALYDATGRLVRLLHDGPTGAGARAWTWDGLDAHGNPVANGLYFVRLRTADAAWVRRLVVLR